MDHCAWKDCKPISLRCDRKINHMAFDGCYYYFTELCNCEIIKSDRSFHMIECFCTCREYDCICYDSVDDCFWASSKRIGGMLYKLDWNMTEIDCTAIEGCRTTGNITGISFDCCNDSLLVSFHTCVIEVCKCSEMAALLYHSPNGCITGVLSLCPVNLITLLINGQSHICVFNDSGQIIDSCPADCKFLLKDVVFDPCQTECGEICLAFLGLKKKNYPYLCTWSFPVSCLNIPICPCNFTVCKKHRCGNRCCCDNICCGTGDCCCEDPFCDGDACADVMESIALMEASMAHILNAEGEKLQKVLSVTDNIDTILCINKEINKTIIHATHLEHTLYAKLSALCDCGCCGQIFSPCPPDCGLEQE